MMVVHLMLQFFLWHKHFKKIRPNFPGGKAFQWEFTSEKSQSIAFPHVQRFQKTEISLDQRLIVITLDQSNSKYYTNMTQI